ncbi:hypothetical protein [Gaoshiqia sp. Z1-71]|uniref:hypothetical protein n=1 Tax=Gaoshiqia hydrogeniformans TaxID=3290090 RepID=UPI003BF80B27
MTKAEYHQLFITKIPIIIQGHRAYNALIKATIPIDDQEGRINKALERLKFNDDDIDNLSEMCQWHEAELEKMGIDPLDHLPFTDEDKAYLDKFLVRIPWHQRLLRKIF